MNTSSRGYYAQNPTTHDTTLFIILRVLDAAQPIGAYDTLILHVLHADNPKLTKKELHGALDYLAQLGCIALSHKLSGVLHCKSLIAAEAQA